MRKHLTITAVLMHLSVTVSASVNAQQHLSPPRPTQAEEQVELDRLLSLMRDRHAAGELIRTRTQWARGLPLRVEISQYGYTDRAILWSDASVEFADCNHNVFAFAGLSHPVRSTEPTWLSWGHDGTQVIPDTCIGEDGKVHVHARFAPLRPGGPETEAETLTFAVELVDSVDDIMTPVANEGTTQHLARTVAVDVLPRQPGQRPDHKAVVAIRFPIHSPPDLTIALRIELLDGDDVVAVARWCATRARYRSIREGLLERGIETHYNPVETDTRLDEFYDRAEGRSLRVRISDDPEYALRDFSSDRYWHGSFVKDVNSHPWDIPSEP